MSDDRHQEAAMSRKQKKKPAHWSGSQMICAYFAREEGLAICCRGEGPGLRLRMTFDTVPGKKEWAKDRCESYDYWKCPLCEMIDEYEGIGEE